MKSEVKCKCGKPATWADEFCQDCWEEYSAVEFWKQAKTTQEWVELNARYEREAKGLLSMETAKAEEATRARAKAEEEEARRRSETR